MRDDYLNVTTVCSVFQHSRCFDPDCVCQCHAKQKVQETSSPVIRRLIEEVRREDDNTKAHSYNRWHNRHNRG